MTGRLSLPRTARLLRPGDFTALRGHSKRASTTCFLAEYRATVHTTARLGMAVSRKVSKLAVTRNRIRRTIRESFRLHRPELPCVDILLIARARDRTNQRGLARGTGIDLVPARGIEGKRRARHNARQFVICSSCVTLADPGDSHKQSHRAARP